MTYVQKTLGNGEQIIYTASFHWTYTASALLALLILGVFLIGVWIFLDMMIRKWTTEIAVTTDRFVMKTGWISRKTEEVSLSKIEEIRLEQSVLGRIFGFGRLHIQGTGVGEIALPDIDEPLKTRRAIANAREQMRDV